MDNKKMQDWAVFTGTVLLLSSTSAIAREELDKLIGARRNRGLDTKDLIQARDRVAALATMAQHYDEARP